MVYKSIYTIQDKNNLKVIQNNKQNRKKNFSKILVILITIQH